jgi:hypothetical protein
MKSFKDFSMCYFVEIPIFFHSKKPFEQKFQITNTWKMANKLQQILEIDALQILITFV